MVFTPFSIDDFTLLDGNRVGANNAQQKLLLLTYAVNRKLKKRNVECPSVVANPGITRNEDVRRAGWAGWIPSFTGVPDPSLNPLSNMPSVSVFIMGEGNFKGEEAGLQIVTEFGDGMHLLGERDVFFRNILNNDFIKYAFLGGDMALRLRGKPETTTKLGSPESFAFFQKLASKGHNAKKNYTVIGRFFTPAEACALADSTVETVSEVVRRLLLLLTNMKA